MRRSGVRLHLFASCPVRLQEHKAGYFRLLRDLQRLSRFTHPDSQDLIERLSRLLFPLSTRFANGSLQASNEPSRQCSNVQTANKNHRSSSLTISHQDNFGVVNGTKTAPFRAPANSENLMPPPLKTSTRSLKRPHLPSERTHSWHKRPHIAEPKQKYDERSDGSNDSSESDSDDDVDSYPVFIPACSPLRNSFGIFCTGRGRGVGMGTGAARAAYRSRSVIRPKQSTGKAQRP